VGTDALMSVLKQPCQTSQMITRENPGADRIFKKILKIKVFISWESVL
jgi:hypothetical protein